MADQYSGRAGGSAEKTETDNLYTVVFRNPARKSFIPSSIVWRSGLTQKRRNMYFHDVNDPFL